MPALMLPRGVVLVLAVLVSLALVLVSLGRIRNAH